MSAMRNLDHDFNDGRSKIILRWMPVNQAWMVARVDGEHVALLRIHNDWADAVYDFDGRLDFIKEMESV